MKIKRVKLKDRCGSPKIKVVMWLVENGDNRKILFQENTDGMTTALVMTGNDVCDTLENLINGNCSDTTEAVQKLINYAWSADVYGVGAQGLDRAEASNFDIEIIDEIPEFNMDETEWQSENMGITAKGYEPNERKSGCEVTWMNYKGFIGPESVPQPIGKKNIHDILGSNKDSSNDGHPSSPIVFASGVQGG